MALNFIGASCSNFCLRNKILTVKLGRNALRKIASRQSPNEDEPEREYFYTATGRKVYYTPNPPSSWRIYQFFQRKRNPTVQRHSILKRLYYRYPERFHMTVFWSIAGAFLFPLVYYFAVPFIYTKEDYQTIAIESRLEFYNRWRHGTGFKLFGFTLPSFSGQTLTLEDLQDEEIEEKHQVIEKLQEELEEKRKSKSLKEIRNSKIIV